MSNDFFATMITLTGNEFQYMLAVQNLRFNSAKLSCAPAASCNPSFFTFFLSDDKNNIQTPGLMIRLDVQQAETCAG